MEERLRLLHPKPNVNYKFLMFGCLGRAEGPLPTQTQKEFKVHIVSLGGITAVPEPTYDLTFVLFSFLVGWDEAHHPTNKKLKITMVKS